MKTAPQIDIQTNLALCKATSGKGLESKIVNQKDRSIISSRRLAKYKKVCKNKEGLSSGKYITQTGTERTPRSDIRLAFTRPF